MGLLDILRRPSTRSGISSPYSVDDSLETLLAADLFGEDYEKWAEHLPFERDQAISIPAVSKNRNLLVSTIARYKLVALGEKWRPVDEDEARSLAPHFIVRGKTQVLKEQPPWLTNTSGLASPYDRMVWTVDSCIFEGVTVWHITEQGAERDGRKPILDAEWVPDGEWTWTDGHMLIHEQPVAKDRYIIINTAFEGLLNIAGRTLRGARDTEEAWTARIRNPIPITEMVVPEDTSLKQKQIDKMAKQWLRQHRAGGPSFGISMGGVTLKTHQGAGGDKDLYIENRNAVRTDVGSFLNTRASMLDGTAGVDSLTYSTTEGEKGSYWELDLPMWTDPIEQCISRALPRGQRVRFDMPEGLRTPAPTEGAPTKD